MAREKTYNCEADVKKEIKRLLDKHGWYWWVSQVGGYGHSGVPDIMAYRKGILLAIEAKHGTNKPSALQRAFLQSIMAEQGLAFVVSDRNIQWFEQWLAAFDRATQAVANKQQVSDEDGALMVEALRILTEAIA